MTMFDWPEHSQTSPISTSCSTTSVGPLASVTSNGPPRSGVVSTQRQLPALSTVPVAVAPHEPRAVHSAPGEPVPVIGTPALAGSTM